MIIRSLWKWTGKKYIAVNKYSIIDAKQKLTLQWCVHEKLRQPWQ